MAETVMASDERGRNFRSAYYDSLGFRENEKAMTLLESLLKSEVIGTDGVLLHLALYSEIAKPTL